MAERVKLFEAKFPGKKLSITALRKIYKKHGIKRKVVSQMKIVPRVN